MVAKIPRQSAEDVLASVTFRPTTLVRKTRTVAPPAERPQVDAVLWETYETGTPSSLTVTGRVANDVLAMVRESRRFLAQRESLDLRLSAQWVKPGTDTLIGDRPVKANESVELRFWLRAPLNRGVRAKQNALARRSRRRKTA